MPAAVEFLRRAMRCARPRVPEAPDGLMRAGLAAIVEARETCREACLGFR